MRSALRDAYTTLRTEGALLPPDLLQRIAEADKSLPGLAPADYHCNGEKLNEAASRAWQRLQGRWAAFETSRAELPADETGTTDTRERWLLPLFQELGYGRLIGARAVELDGRSYPVSHVWQTTPIHLVGCNVKLDTRAAGVAGAARQSPHSLVQELLNRSDHHLWAFVTNGLQLRILRDNVSLSRQAYVEFDLEAMLRGELYADFVLLWLLCHESRVEAEKPQDCWLEHWMQEAQQQGVRALDGLRSGVQRAIEVLGRGFLAHGGNSELLEKLRDGRLENLAYYRQLLRLVYRLLFLFTAEDRDLLLLPALDDDDAGAEQRRLARERFMRYYSTAKLRDLGARRRGARHSDLYEAVDLVCGCLGSDQGCPQLALPALGSFLFSEEALPDLDGCRIANSDLLEAVRALAFTAAAGTLRSIDFRNLGAEELGSVYESLLEMQPVLNRDAATFELRVVSGSERKTTGSYYTPTSLIQVLLDSALEPVVEDRLKGKHSPEERAQAILDLKVCDPACGSGHFLIAAAHRLARHLAAARTGDEEPSPQATRTALRDVIGRCIYGVDINPMAAELCKVNLWLEAVEPGKPLSFLDHHIQVGNSLLGTTPQLIEQGIPDEAFTPIEGDDTKVCRELKKRNRRERSGQAALFDADEPSWTSAQDLQESAADIERLDDSTLDGVNRKSELYREAVAGESYRAAKLVADAWCATFVSQKTEDSPGAVTEERFRRLRLDPLNAPTSVRVQAESVARQYGCLHWHLQFPDVFSVPARGHAPDNEQTGWSGGFDIVLGNPPWDRVKLQEKEWFAAHGRADIATAPNAARRKALIDALEHSVDQSDVETYGAFRQDQRMAEGTSLLLRSSGRYPLCGRGDVNVYALFAENNSQIMGPSGRAGFIVPTGIATDDTTKEFFASIVGGRSLAAFYGFENEARLFSGVDHRVNFCLLVLSATAVDRPEFSAFIREPVLLSNPDRVYHLSASDIAALNPNTRTCPVFRSRRDADLNLAIYRRSGVLWDESSRDGNPWGLRFLSMFHMANDSGLFRTRFELERDGQTLSAGRFLGSQGVHLPLFEAKMVYHYNHRYGDFALLSPGEREHILPQVSDEKLADPDYVTLPRYWVHEKEVESRLSGFGVPAWLLGWRDVTDPRSSMRTVVACVIPRTAVSGKLPLLMSHRPDLWLLYANLGSYVLDYAGRQKVGGVSLSMFIMKQLPLLPPEIYQHKAPWAPDQSLEEWLKPRVLELTYTSHDIAAFAKSMGYAGDPFPWNRERRMHLRCQLDAAFFHLYGLDRGSVDHVMDTFPIVKRREEARLGEYRTKDWILCEFDAMGGLS